MIPINELLSRIRWDKKFGYGDFEIGYYDRLLDKIIRVPFAYIVFDKDDRNTIQVLDKEGAIHGLPLHRIYQVFRDNVLIWDREREKHSNAKE
ncbi:MAG: DUF504 domain-containing protein [Proteobacteria bacterium]|nr:DUF504 domain-containing protein [Pseudomonadota bacterium]MBU1234933.1 DUF504 domain-containing protein [Pseudomonadota bacterium]MBU1420556.1 DUF504 domain-containing protein [Pseudomonadota bacterium]MBU1456119.1 DUF504 domain-containing protein [Pseudomonadota bacterium]